MVGKSPSRAHTERYTYWVEYYSIPIRVQYILPNNLLGVGFDLGIDGWLIAETTRFGALRVILQR
jgi:hypothetical protein